MAGQKVIRGVLHVGRPPASVYLRQALLQTGTAATAGTDGRQDGGTEAKAVAKVHVVVHFLSYRFPFVHVLRAAPFLPHLQMVCTLLAEYLRRLSGIIDNKLNCGPVLSWMEVRRAEISRACQD